VRGPATRGEYPASPPNLERADGSNEPTLLRLKGYQISFCLPSSIDLLKLATLADTEQARQHLLNACLVFVKRRKQAVSVSNLPPDIVQAAALANLIIAATCAACAHKWEVVFNIVSYFWSEINAWAACMMHEIYTLASVYGWREADNLARQHYLETIGA
jgi:hypothetical protein